MILSLSVSKKSRANMIARSLSSSCKIFNVVHYSKGIKIIYLKVGILAHDGNVQLPDEGHNCKSYSFGVIPNVT